MNDGLGFTLFAVWLVIASGLISAVATWLALTPSAEQITHWERALWRQAAEIDQLRDELAQRPESAALLCELGRCAVIDDVAANVAKWN